MGSFKTDCKYCEEEILLSNDNEAHKWKPYDINDDQEDFDEEDIEHLEIHSCRQREPIFKECDYCGNEIYFSENANGKWLPYSSADSLRHFCKKN